MVCCRMFLGMVCGKLRETTRMGVYGSPRGIAGRSGREFSVESSLAHRWRYASTQDPIGSKYLHNDNRSVWITGDWCLGKGILSAHASALSVASELRKDEPH